MNRVLKSKKGISPILATLLLIVIALAAFIVTYAWVITFTGTQPQPAGVLLSQENVAWPDADTITVVIKNIGTDNGKITAVYMGTSSTNLDLSITVSPMLADSSATINAGFSKTFTITYTWTANTVYYFKFATDTQTNLEFSAKSPL